MSASVMPPPGELPADAAAGLRQQFLTGMSFAASTVNVVTTDGPAGRLGVTVSAMSSVSADGARPTLLVCVHHLSAAANAIIENGVFCVNVLRDSQSNVSDSFAGRIKQPGGDKFACAEWLTGVTGSPRVAGALAAFDCRLKSQQRVGTHHVFIGEVEEISTAEAGSPLIYANRAYGTPAPLFHAPASSTGETLAVGVFHTFAPYVLPEILTQLAARGYGVETRLFAGDQDDILKSLRLGETDIALLYDFDIGPEFEVRRLAALDPYVLLPEAHPLAGRHAVSLSDLAGLPMVLLDSPPSGQYFRSLFAAAGLTPDIRYRSSSFETVRSLVAHGLGFSLLTTKPAAAMSYDGRSLVTCRLTDETAKSQLALVTRKGAVLTPAAAAFSDITRSMFH